MAKKKKVTKKEKSGRIKVVATRLGYYGDQRRPVNDIFYIKNEKEMGSWMKRASEYKAPVEDDEEPGDDDHSTGDEDVV